MLLVVLLEGLQLLSLLVMEIVCAAVQQAAASSTRVVLPCHAHPESALCWCCVVCAFATSRL